MRNFRYRTVVGFAFLIFVAVLIPLVVRSPYYLHLVIITGMNAILAMTFIMMLRTGLISLAIACFWGIGAYSSAAFVMKAGLSFWVALPFATVTTGIISLAVGFLVVRNPGFGFLMLTATIGMLIVLVFGNIGWLGGFTGIEYIPPPNKIVTPFAYSVSFSSKTAYYILMVVLFLVVVISFWALYNSSIGRAWMAIGLNPHLAESIGVSVFRYRLLAFVIASMVAGAEGSFYAHYIGSITPNAFDIFKTIHVHIYAILGGINSAFFGPIIGTAVMTFVPESLRIAEEIEPILTGALLILLIIFLPGGLLSLFNLSAHFRNPLKAILRSGDTAKRLPLSIERKYEEKNPKG